MSYSKRILDDLSDEELERIFSRPDNEEWPSEEEMRADESNSLSRWEEQ